jgi:hypothetical protein
MVSLRNCFKKKIWSKNPTNAIKFIPTSDEAADPNDVNGLFQALTDGGWGGLIGPTEKKSQGR